ncbi:hypothetical protein [Pseudomonas benzopyrenica]|uniref:hypothetical protein n=1 Tax=Pseudomonas benzopyrenica TaxID=2993566 RepID=UPI003F15D828
MCLIENCKGLTYRAKVNPGYCRRHWHELGDYPRCSVEGCNGMALARGLCKPHAYPDRKWVGRPMHQPTAEDAWTDKPNLCRYPRLAAGPAAPADLEPEVARYVVELLDEGYRPKEVAQCLDLPLSMVLKTQDKARPVLAL